MAVLVLSVELFVEEPSFVEVLSFVDAFSFTADEFLAAVGEIVALEELFESVL